MITSTSSEWVLLSEVYHHVLAQSPSPESAKMTISTAIRNGRLRVRADLREHKAQPQLEESPVMTDTSASRKRVPSTMHL
jgi:hypothetical protein